MVGIPTIYGDMIYLMMFDDLVGGLEHFLFSHILGISSAQLTNIFQRGWNYQPDSIFSIAMFDYRRVPFRFKLRKRAPDPYLKLGEVPSENGH